MPDSTDAIVLRRIPYADTSLVVHLFAPERGRVAALAKGAFRPTSPHFASLDLLDRVKVRLLGRREGGLALLGDTELLDSHRRLRTRANALAAAFYTAELVDTALTEAPAPELYARLLQWLMLLDAEKEPSPGQVASGLIAFELRFLDSLGLRPILDRCAECGRELLAWDGSRVFAAASAGGALCDVCVALSQDPLPLSRSTLAAAGGLLSGEDSRPLPSRQLRELRALLDRFHAYHLERALRSRPALERIRVSR
jgi:DNA repair protein RecO (recombination protein O)